MQEHCGLIFCSLLGKTNTHKHKQIWGIVPGLRVFLGGHLLMGRKTHKQNPPKIPGQSRKFCLCISIFQGASNSVHTPNRSYHFVSPSPLGNWPLPVPETPPFCVKSYYFYRISCMNESTVFPTEKVEAKVTRNGGPQFGLPHLTRINLFSPRRKPANYLMKFFENEVGNIIFVANRMCLYLRWFCSAIQTSLDVHKILVRQIWFYPPPSRKRPQKWGKSVQISTKNTRKSSRLWHFFRGGGGNAILFRTRSTTTRDRNLQFRGTVSTGGPPLDFLLFSRFSV